MIHASKVTVWVSKNVPKGFRAEIVYLQKNAQEDTAIGESDEEKK